MIASSFNFIDFFVKYKLDRSDNIVQILVRALNDGDIACDFIIQYIDKRCVELEPIIRNSKSWDKYYHFLLKNIATGWRCIDRVDTSNIEERILDGSSWLILYALQEGKIPQYRQAE